MSTQVARIGGQLLQDNLLRELADLKFDIVKLRKALKEVLKIVCEVHFVPIYKNEDQLNIISDYAGKLKKELSELNISVKFDNDKNKKPGWKFAEYELKGVPLEIS